MRVRSVAPTSPATASAAVFVSRASDRSASSNRPARPDRTDSAARPPTAAMVFVRSVSCAVADRAGVSDTSPTPYPTTPQTLVRALTS